MCLITYGSLKMKKIIISAFIVMFATSSLYAKAWLMSVRNATDSVVKVINHNGESILEPNNVLGVNLDITSDNQLDFKGWISLAGVHNFPMNWMLNIVRNISHQLFIHKILLQL